MGITKQYLRWEPATQFGIIGSQSAGACLIKQWPEMVSTDRICATAACENIAFWDTKTCELVDKIATTESGQDSKSWPISCLQYSAVSNVLASGHGDGSIRLFDCRTKELKVVFSGHKGFVSCLAFDSSGLRIASAGKDTEIVVWDVTNSSGLFRLRGHKGPVNKVDFMKEHPWILISASSDSFIKFWDLNTQHCFKTLSDHRSEVWSFVLLKDDTRLISGGSDSELKVWKIIFSEENQEQFEQKAIQLKNRRLEKMELLGENFDSGHSDEFLEDDSEDFILVERYGSILRKSSEKVSNISLDPTERLLICHGKDQYFEGFKIRNPDEIKHKVKNRLRKERKRQLGEAAPAIDEQTVEESTTLSDEVEKLETVKTSARVKSVDIKVAEGAEQQFKVVVLLANNALELHQTSLGTKTFTSELASHISGYGHRNDVRTVSISSDSLSILTASSDSVKLWNKSSCRCVATINEDIQYPLCSLFAPGDKHVLLGTKSGKIQVINLASARVQSTIDGSDTASPIWSICLLPDLTGIVSGSEDKRVKFWSFDLVVDAEDNSRQLTLCHERSLELEEGVICVKVSPNSKFVAASLLDSTVKIHFVDTGKFFLSLYGHKFPVLCMDISYDNHIIVTGSSDKNIKIWGMDFGDCHRSLFAHDDNIMCLSFIPRTHQFFTASKDFKIKMWDGDHFEKITTLEAHHGEIWAMAVAPNGKYLVSAAHDKTLRTWIKTNEPLILQEEKELENERQFEKEFEESSQTVVAGESGQQEAGLAQKNTTKTIRSVEKIIEAIDIFNEESSSLKRYQELCAAYEKLKLTSPSDSNVSEPVREPVNPHLLAYRTECPYRFMLEVLMRVKSNEIEETLLELPFSYTRQLLEIIHQLLNRRWEVELLCRCVCFIIRVNFGQITSTPSLVALMDKVRVQMREAMAQVSDLVGVNTVALEHFQSVYESRQDVSLFAEIVRDTRTKRNKKHRKQTKTAPILSWT